MKTFKTFVRKYEADLILLIVLVFIILVTSFAFALDRHKKIIPFVSAKVVDGDTIHIVSQGKFGQLYKIKLEGIDAPELKQMCLDQNGKEWECGKEAAKALKEKLESCEKTVKCYVELGKKDKYKRYIGTIQQQDVEEPFMVHDINYLMVYEGWTVAYLKYSKKYKDAQEYAQEHKKGIWNGKFLDLAFYRKGKNKK